MAPTASHNEVVYVYFTPIKHVFRILSYTCTVIKETAMVPGFWRVGANVDWPPQKLCLYYDNPSHKWIRVIPCLMASISSTILQPLSLHSLHNYTPPFDG